MQEVVNERHKPPSGRPSEPPPRPECKLCGKPLREDVVQPWGERGPLCFWCAYVEPQG